MAKNIKIIILVLVALVVVVGLIVGLSVGLTTKKTTCTSCLNIENWFFYPHIDVYLVGVQNTEYSFSKSIDKTKFEKSIAQLRKQKTVLKDIYIPTTLLNGQIVVVKNFDEFNNEVFSDVIISYGTFGCQAFGIASADAMPYVISDGKFVAVGAISHSNCRMASNLINIIKTNFTNGRLDNLRVFLGPSSRSPNYYVGESIFNNYTKIEQDKYFKKINPGDKDKFGNVIIHKRDAFDGLPRYGFDFSIFFKDSLIELGIKEENIEHDQRDSIYSNAFSSVRAEYARIFNNNPNTTLTPAQINESVGRNLMLVGCN